MKTTIKILQWIGTIVVVIAILLLAFMLIAPRFGIQLNPVLSGSMEPALKVGGMVVTRPTAVENVKVGDVIGFKLETGQRVTHRVVDIQNKDGKLWFQTKGDANEDPDPNYVAATSTKIDRVIGHVPYLGFAAKFMKSRWGFFAFIAIPALLLVLIFGKGIWEGIQEERQKRKAKAAAAADKI